MDATLLNTQNTSPTPPSHQRVPVNISAVIAVLDSVSHVPQAGLAAEGLRTEAVTPGTVNLVRDVRSTLMAEAVPDHWIDNLVDQSEWQQVEDLITERERQAHILREWLDEADAADFADQHENPRNV